VVFGYLPSLSLLLLLTLIPVQKNIGRFFKKQVKEETFILSVKNFILFLLVHTVLITAGSLLPGWGML
jgi:1,4-dihydroxy-2-naphthoate octaprenyltransferase